jgi:DUF4097 and DUF4098 domain-containing protein YvlB
MSSESSEFTFKVPSPAHLKLSNISGSVTIQPGEDDHIHVLAVKNPDCKDADNTTIVCTQAENGAVTISTRYSDPGWRWLFGNQVCDVDYVVKAPRQCSLNLNGVSNSLFVSGFEGEFVFKTVSGDMTLHSLTGSLKIDSVSGDVSGELLAGPIQIKSVSGDFNLRDSNLISANVNTVSGDVSLQTGLFDGPYKFHSVSGDVRLVVPAISSCDVEMHSVSGDLSTNLPVNQSSHGHGNHTARIGAGGVRVTLNSVSGDLMLESDGEISLASEKNSLEIISKVESGEISVADALEQLNG